MDCLTKIPSATSGIGTIYCDTWNGGNKLGTSGVGITINVPSSVQPSFSSLGTEGNNLQWGKYVQWHSKCKLSINGATGSYGSWVTSYRITGSNIDCYEWQGWTGSITNYGNITYTATITDSRGRTASKTATIYVENYFNPSFNWSKAFRCNSSGTMDSTSGTSVNVSASWGHASVGGSNGSICYVSGRELPNGGWGGETQISIGASKVLGGTYSLSKEYEIRFRVNDGLGANVYSYIKVPTSACVIGYKAGGQGLSIGKHPTRNGLEVDWEAIFNKGIYCANDTGMSWSSNGDGGHIVFHADNPSGASYIRYCVNDDLDEYHVFGGQHWNDGWREWAKIDNWGISTGRLSTSSSGYADNIKVGDDAWIGDCNIDNSIMVKGNQNGKAGWIYFGDGGGKIGYNGAKGSSIDIYPTGNNGADNQVFIGGQLTVRDDLYLSSTDISGRRNYVAQNNVNGARCKSYFGILGWGPEPGLVLEISKNEQSVQAIIIQAGVMFPNTGDICNLGQNSNKWRAVWAVNGSIQSSDRSLKDNINYISYIDEHTIDNPYYISSKEQEIERSKHYDFIRGINFAKWDWKDDNNIDGLDNIGFIAQDIVDTEIGDRILYYDEDGGYGYSLSNYVTTIAIALQHSINEVEELKAENKELKDRLAKIEAMLGVV